jgi:hypothetical protein
VIKGLDHLSQLLLEFADYYNCWRPHSALKGTVPESIHADREWSPPPKTAKTIPANIKRRFFPETRITGFRLAAWLRRPANLCCPSRLAAHYARTPPESIPPPLRAYRGLMLVRSSITPSANSSQGNY